MPVISRFYGIIIAMYFNDHNPPHFHAKYGGWEALLTLDGKLIEGQLPHRAMGFVLEWIQLHQHELEENWRRAQSSKPLLSIDPLE